tara:strand:- start:3351 stop:4301 length:951 start_codon:yes stop_codon:yes gene_type:complete
MQIGIVEKENFSIVAIKELQKHDEVEIYKLANNENDNLMEFIKNKEIIFVRLKYYFSKEILKHAKSLQYICSPTTGLNHIDLDYCKTNNIKVISLKGEVEFLKDIRATSEHTLSLILSLIRNHSLIIKNKNLILDRNNFLGHEIYNNKLGIIGFGRIGLLLSKYLNAMGAEIYFYDKNNNIKSEYEAKKLKSIDEVINKCDIICLCASYDNNEYIINSNHIISMKDKFFVNTSRGELVDEEFLIKKIKENHFKGVAIDVIKDESKNTNNLKKIIEIDHPNINFIYTPHVAGATLSSINRTELFIVDKLKNILNYGI